MTQIPQGNNMFWDVQSAVTVSSTAAGTNVSSYNLVTMHLDGEIYTNFGASSTAAISTACLLYTSDAADDLTRVDLGGRRII